MIIDNSFLAVNIFQPLCKSSTYVLQSGEVRNIMPILQMGKEILKEGSSEAPDPVGLAEACALEPVDTLCPWPAATVFF